MLVRLGCLFICKGQALTKTNEKRISSQTQLMTVASLMRFFFTSKVVLVTFSEFSIVALKPNHSQFVFHRL